MVTLNDISNRLDELERKFVIATKPMLTIDEAVQYTGYTKASLYTKVSRHQIPCYRAKKGGKLFFNKTELDKWMCGLRQCSDDELDAIASRYLATT